MKWNLKEKYINFKYSLKKQDNNENFRINLIIAIVIVCFSAIIFTSFKSQITNGNYLKDLALQTTGISIKQPMPRGDIVDRNGNVLATSVRADAISFIPKKETNASNTVELAKEYAQHINVDSSDLTNRQKKEYVLFSAENWKTEYLTPEEISNMKKGRTSVDNSFDLALERISDDKINSFSQAELNEIQIWVNLNNGYSSDMKYIKIDNLSQEEKDYVIQASNVNNSYLQLSSYWKRVYPYGDAMSNLIGKVSSEKQGIPVEEVKLYTSQGLPLNETVGVSGLEFMFDSTLRGEDAVTKVYQKSDGSYETLKVSEGQKGNSVKLTVDINYQQEVENELKSTILQMRSSMGGIANKGYVVVENPNTGELLAVAGKQYDPSSSTWIDISNGAIYDSYTPGSIVKPVTLITGLNEGAINKTEKINDQPMNILGTKQKSSVKNFGPVNGQEALMYSSNVYMWNTIIRLGGGKYVPNEAIQGMDSVLAINTLRKFQNQFGLGVATGINLPSESVGMKGGKINSGYAMDQAVGQYDTYTPIQVAQYASTIADKGNRTSPVLISSIYNNNSVVQTFQTKQMNQVSASAEDIEYTRRGMWMVNNDSRSTSSRWFRNSAVSTAGKSGTAEAFENGTMVYHTNYIAFAPYDDPSLAVAVLIPGGAAKDESTYSMGGKIASFAINEWFNNFNK